MATSTDPNTLMQFLEAMNGTRWIIAGVTLLVLELLTGTTYLLWPAAAALIVGLIAFILPGAAFGWVAQFLLFSILTLVLLWLGHTKLRPRMNAGEPTDLNDKAQSMKGMRVTAIADFETGRGRVQVGDTQWRASMETGTAKAGDELRVMDIKGTTLMVELV